MPFGRGLPSVSAAGEITMVSTWLIVCTGELASVTFTVTVVLPATVGVPLTTQPDNDSPAGRDPVIVQEYGAVPPAAVMEALYATPTVPLGRTFARLKGELTLIETAAVAVAPRLSFTCTVNAKVPLAVGVPEITPELAEIPRPGGNDPAAMLHEYGVEPPAAIRDVL